MLRLLVPHAAVGCRKARFGCPGDGGYVLIDDFEGIGAAISCGIEANASWDIAVADRGVTVYQFDFTVDAAPTLRSDLIFSKTRIVPLSAPGGVTLNEIASRHGYRPNSLILKIDIEHDEWSALDGATEQTLACFSQIVGEFHGFDFMVDQSWIARSRRVLEKINRQFAVVHVHANNYAGIFNIANIPVPGLLEITFANRSRYDLQRSDEIFPGSLDSPNDPGRPDIFLGKFAH